MYVRSASRILTAEPATDWPFRNGDRMDQATFHKLYETLPDGCRAELISGVVYFKMPTPSEHGRPQRRVVGWLDFYVSHTPGVDSLDASTNKFDPQSEPEPDACLYLDAACGGRTYYDEKDYLIGPPELVVEVAYSTRGLDLGDKKSDYERAGVLEYIVVLPKDRKVTWFVRRKQSLTAIPPAVDGLFRSAVFPGLWMDPAGVFDRGGGRLYESLRKGLASPEHAAFVTAQEKKLVAAKSKRKKR
jgi:Uma2 family endonuclease